MVRSTVVDALEHPERSGGAEFGEVARFQRPLVDLERRATAVSGVGEHVVNRQDARRRHERRPLLVVAVGRFGTVDEVADTAVMLARNGYITGQTINVNGGWFMS